MTEPEIERVIARVKAGCLEDYGAIVATYHERLRVILAPRCPPGVEIDDVAHLAFVEAYRQLERYVAGTNFFAWLCAIARYRLLTECEIIRRQSRNRANYLQHAITERLQPAIEADTTVEETRLQLLEDCLGALSPEARSLIEQRYQKRQSVHLLAAALGRTAVALSVQLFGLRKKLRDCIEHKLHALRVANQ